MISRILQTLCGEAQHRLAKARVVSRISSSAPNSSGIFFALKNADETTKNKGGKMEAITNQPYSRRFELIRKIGELFENAG